MVHGWAYGNKANMRVALITGGARGLGLATAQRLAEDGMTVVIADLNGSDAKEAAASLRGNVHRGIALDVTVEESVSSVFAEVEGAIGPVAVLACFAGILSTASKPGKISLMDIGAAEWDTVNAVNARGTFLCIREMARRRTATPVAHGRIIAVSSLAGQIGGLQSGAAYSASKGAVLSLTKVAARELASLGITVNAIAPGAIDTPMLRATLPEGSTETKYAGAAQIPLGRVGEPFEIAAAVAFLASSEAGFVTGATIDVNGGLSMR